ncbi:hypothetical protein [Stenotrophomonas panacihumi]|nr:hypothetical protein [Stenotrophomonas panacihumi]
MGLDLTPADLARAIGLQQGSISGWFGKGKPTKMISGDNLVATARFLRTSAEYIMTGDGATAIASQPVGLDLGKLSTVLAVVEGAVKDSRKAVPVEFKARMIQRVYESQHALTADSASAVQAALAGLLETLGTD